MVLGTAGNASPFAVNFSNNSLVTSVDGDIQITGQGDADTGVNVFLGAVVSSTGTGAEAATITINGHETTTQLVQRR